MLYAPGVSNTLLRARWRSCTRDRIVDLGDMGGESALPTLSSTCTMMPRRVLLLVALVGTVQAAIYSPSDAVVHLNEDSFADLMKDDGVALVEFYAPWCGHCQSLAPHFKKVATSLQGIAVVAAVDCDDKKNSQLCSSQNIKGFPTLKLFGPDKLRNPYTKELTKEAIDYNGPRTAKPMSEALTALLTDVYITRIQSAAEWDAFRASRPDAAKVVLVSNRAEPTTLYKALSTQLRGLAFCEVHEDIAGSGLGGLDGKLTAPTLLVLKTDGSVEQYQGEYKAVALLQYLISFLPDAPSMPGKAGKGAASGDEATAPKTAAALPTLAVADLLSKVDVEEDMHLVAFYDGSAGAQVCTSQLSAVAQTVADMQAVVKVSALDVGEAGVDVTALAEQFGLNVAGLKDSPCSVQLVLLPFGTDKSELGNYQRYTGSLDGKALQTWVTDAMPSTAAELTLSSFSMFMHTAGATAATSITPKVLLFTNKNEAPGVYKALALNFRRGGRLAFGWIHANSPDGARLMKEMHINKVPSLVVVMPNPGAGDTPPDAKAMPLHVQPYHGPLRYNDMAAFVAEIAAFADRLAGIAPSDLSIDTLVPHFVDDAAFAKGCTDQAGLCVIGLLDGAADSLNATIGELALIASQVEGQPLHFGWIDARKFRDVCDAFRVLSSDIPSLIALSPKRMRYATLSLVGSGSGGVKPLSSQSVGKFLSSVLSGKARTDVLQELPRLVEGGTSEGSLGAEPEEPIIEEFDLSDILSEEVEGGPTSAADRLRQVDAELEAEREAAEAAKKEAPRKKKKKKSKKSKASSAHDEL